MSSAEMVDGGSQVEAPKEYESLVEILVETRHMILSERPRVKDDRD